MEMSLAQPTRAPSTLRARERVPPACVKPRAERPPRPATGSDSQDRGAPETPLLQIRQRIVRPLERVDAHLAAHGHTRRERQELLGVAPGEVGHRAERALAPQELVWERGDGAHVYAAAH